MLINSKFSKIFCFVLLVGGDCFASASPLKYSEEAEQALVKFSGGHAWRFQGQSLSQQLLQSSREGNVKALAQVLATRRINPDFTSDKKEFALEEAIEGMRRYKKGQQVECIKLLLLCGANPNRESKRWPGRTLIFRAVQLSDSALVKALLDGGADATKLDCDKKSVLYWTQWAANESDRHVRSFLEQYFLSLIWRAVKVENNRAFARLMCIFCESRELSQLEKKCFFGVPDEQGLTLLDYADQLMQG
ncbi:hypothetical protein IPF37_05165 [bacterium]|nr:MAG: hypothetical protein IPF37_05165 [bacterium]